MSFGFLVINVCITENIMKRPVQPHNLRSTLLIYYLHGGPCCSLAWNLSASQPEWPGSVQEQFK